MTPTVLKNLVSQYLKISLLMDKQPGLSRGYGGHLNIWDTSGCTNLNTQLHGKWHNTA